METRTSTILTAAFFCALILVTVILCRQDTIDTTKLKADMAQQLKPEIAQQVKAEVARQVEIKVAQQLKEYIVPVVHGKYVDVRIEGGAVVKGQ